MDKIITIGETQLSAQDWLTKMQDYQLWPKFMREFVIEQAIAPIECPPEELERNLNAYFAAQKIPPESREAWLQQKGVTLNFLTAQMSQKLRLQQFKQQTWGHQLESVFLKQKGRLDQVTYSLLRTKDAGMAQELYCRLLEEEATFEELASQYSGGSEAKTGGRVGPVPITTPHQALASLLAISEPGQLWPPQKFQDWHLIVRLEELKPARLDEPTQAKLLEELFEQWVQEQIQQTPVQLV